MTVAELKAALAAKGVSLAGCVEKAELYALWLRSGCPAARGAPPAAGGGGLRATAAPAGASAPWHRATGVAGCGATEASPFMAARGPASPQRHGTASPRRGASLGEAEARQREARREVARILSLRQEAYPSAAAWAFEVLGAPRCDAAAAQRGYRALMKRLHPDKAEQSPRVAKAAHLVQEARDVVERSLRRLAPPPPPQRLRASHLCEALGRRRLRVSWMAPADREDTPVQRYVVALLDPAYGRALTVAQLEPDYSPQHGRFLSIKELTSYVLDEQELQKMPRFWQQRRATVQVAAGNESGQSVWASIEVPIGSY